MTGFELKEAKTELEFVEDRFYDFPEETGVSNSINNIQNAIKAIEELEEYYAIGTVKECREAVERANSGGWIACEDRLPSKEECEKDNGSFLVQSDNGERFCCEFDSIANGYDNPLWCCNVPIIAWQPLPEPYRP